MRIVLESGFDLVSGGMWKRGFFWGDFNNLEIKFGVPAKRTLDHFD